MRGVVRWGFVAGIMAFVAAAHADNWPSHLIKATIPFGAGSAADVVPRVVFDRLAAELGQAIVVENRPGAGGTIGTAAVVKADADGYNILAQSSALAISPAIYPKLPFDITRDLTSALMIGVSANVMIVPVSRPWKTVQDFIADAKARPGSIVIRLGRRRQRRAYQRREIPSRGRDRNHPCALSRRRGSDRRYSRRPYRFLLLPARNRAAADQGGPCTRARDLDVEARGRIARRADPGRSGPEKRGKRVLARRIHAGEDAARHHRQVSRCGNQGFSPSPRCSKA